MHILQMQAYKSTDRYDQENRNGWERSDVIPFHRYIGSLFSFSILFATAALSSSPRRMVPPKSPVPLSTDNCLVLGPRLPNTLNQSGLDEILMFRSADENRLKGASISNCVISHSLASAHLEGTIFSDVQASGISFENAHLEDTLFASVSLRGSNFGHASLNRARFEGQGNNLTDVIFDGADLSGVQFEDCSLARATFWGANLDGVIFDVRELPDVLSLASAQHIETMRSPLRQVGLHKLSQTLADFGLGREGRAVAFAAEESVQDRFRSQCWTGSDYALVHRLPAPQRLGYCMLFATRAVAYDFTCRFGRDQWRPIWLIVLIICLIAFVNLTILLVRPSSSLFLIIPSLDREKRRTISFRKLIHYSVNCSNRRMRGWKRIRACATVAIRLSLQSAFTLPAKDLDVGKWMQMVWGREMTFVANGSLRSIAGAESLLCFGLLIVWILVVFSRSEDHEYLQTVPRPVAAMAKHSTETCSMNSSQATLVCAWRYPS
jgi:uncharacterized protein YjbI with pentapeptide repeats